MALIPKSMKLKRHWIVRLDPKVSRKRHLVLCDNFGGPGLRTLCGKRYEISERKQSWKGGVDFTDKDCRACLDQINGTRLALTATINLGGKTWEEAEEDAHQLLGLEAVRD
jgi:hypothetical protein